MLYVLVAQGYVFEVFEMLDFLVLLPTILRFDPEVFIKKAAVTISLLNILVFSTTNVSKEFMIVISST